MAYPQVIPTLYFREGCGSTRDKVTTHPTGYAGNSPHGSGTHNDRFGRLGGITSTSEEGSDGVCRVRGEARAGEGEGERCGQSNSGVGDVDPADTPQDHEGFHSGSEDPSSSVGHSLSKDPPGSESEEVRERVGKVTECETGSPPRGLILSMFNPAEESKGPNHRHRSEFARESGGKVVRYKTVVGRKRDSRVERRLSDGEARQTKDRPECNFPHRTHLGSYEGLGSPQENPTEAEAVWSREPGENSELGSTSKILQHLQQLKRSVGINSFIQLRRARARLVAAHYPTAWVADLLGHRPGSSSTKRYIRSLDCRETNQRMKMTSLLSKEGGRTKNASPRTSW